MLKSISRAWWYARLPRSARWYVDVTYYGGSDVGQYIEEIAVAHGLTVQGKGETDELHALFLLGTKKQCFEATVTLAQYEQVESVSMDRNW